MEPDGFGNPEHSVLACEKPAGYVADNSDCDDGDASVNPAQIEINDDGIDNNCDGRVDEAVGSIIVNITPAEAVSDGAKWRLDDGELLGSGTTVDGIDVGDHSVDFLELDGWAAPVSQTVEVLKGQTATTTAEYLRTGSLTVALEPAEAVADGAKWNIDGGAWNESGATVEGITVGDHAISFSDLPLWDSPSDQTVLIAMNQTSDATAYYAPAVGLLTVTLSPGEAVAEGAQWRLDDEILHESGDTLELTPGEHTLSFTEIASFLAPVSRTVSVVKNQELSIEAGYQRIAQFPFYDGFEEGLLGENWQTDANPGSRVLVRKTCSPHSGSYHLTMDSCSGAVLNELILAINLYGQSQVGLSFFHKEFGDEDHPMSDTFIGQEDSDGVAVSDDGITWYKAQGLTSADSISSAYREFTVDLDAVANANGFSYTDRFLIKFQHFDNSIISSDGFAFDDIAVYTAISSLSVSIEPAGAVSGGAMWRIEGGDWLESGETAPLEPGDYSISFSDVPGFVAPPVQTVEIFEDKPSFLEVKYPEKAPFPFSDDFESGVLEAYWEAKSTNSGRIRVTGDHAPYGGSYHLCMDSEDGSYALNELVLAIDLSGQSDVVLAFQHKEFGDEDHTMSDAFAGSENSDGIAFCNDAVNWHKLQGLATTDGISSSYKKFIVDLDAATGACGLTYDDIVYIKFQQYDNSPITTDGFAFDNIQIYKSSTFCLDGDQDGFGDPGSSVVAPADQPPQGYVANDEDCDDSDANEHPGQTCYKDADGDGYSDGTTGASCERPSGYKLASELIATSGDCEDGDSSANPGATETCNGKDDDCDGSVDEGVKSTYYLDAEGDTFGDPVVSVQACEAPEGHVANGEDCDDADADEHPGQTWYKDADGDGYSDGTTGASCERPSGYRLASELIATSGDCEDGDSSANPGATETCNGKDDDCDGSEDEGVKSAFYLDADGDTFGDTAVSVQACEAPEGHVADGSDCDDTDANKHPGQIWYKDSDGDGYSDSTTSESCERPFGHKLSSELIATSGDCDDSDGSFFPNAPEICDDGIDQDCDGFDAQGCTLSLYRDADGDGYGDGDNEVKATAEPMGYVADNSDCDDGNGEINPSAEEIPDDSIDNDCDGLFAQTYFADEDGDGYGDPGNSVADTSQPAGHVTDNNDCDDSDPETYPGAPEIPGDGIDQDCDGSDPAGSTLRVPGEYPTIQSAIDTSEDWDTVLVADGTYAENIDFIGKKITVVSENGPEAAVIDAGGVGHVVVFENNENQYSILDGFTLANGFDSDGGGIYCRESSPTILNCIVKDNHVDSNGGGVYLWHSSPKIVNTNIVSNSGKYGAAIYAKYASPQILHCTMSDNFVSFGFGGYIRVVESISLPVLKNCILWGNTGAYSDYEISFYNNPDIDVTYSDIQNGSGVYPGTGNINSDPFFVDAANGDFHLGLDSPCIDSADPATTLAFDMDGDPRPMRDGFDMGADEVPPYFYRDADEDGFGDASAGIGVPDGQIPPGYVENDEDCDDADADEHPGQNWYKDAEGDGYSDGTVQASCERPSGHRLASELTATSGDCEDGDPAIHPGAMETCNDKDDDCDGSVDEGVKSTYYLDADGDSFGDPAVSVQACEAPEGYVTNNEDCDDSNAEMHQAQTWYKDEDGDGYSDGTSIDSCEKPQGYKVSAELIDSSIDCRDDDSSINPGASEECNSVDDNCNQLIDEGCLEGDINGDNSINVLDAVLALQIMSGAEIDGHTIWLGADCNNDKAIGIEEAAMIIRSLAGD